MRRTKLTCGLIAGALLLSVACAAALVAWQYVRPQPAATTQTPFEGVTYIREVRTSPRDLVIHIALIDLDAPGIRVLVTPGDTADPPLEARTTSDFLSDFDLQLAVNGDTFEPWHANSPVDYYPHTGDRVDATGYAASEGTAYSEAHKETPTLYIQQTNNARFNRPFSNVYNAVSGTEMLIENGRIVAPGEDNVEPRTAVGLNRSANTLILVVIDGRQPGYSEGVTLRELADIMAFYEAHDAMNLDGGGSSTMVREGGLGQAVVLNNPVGRTLPGTERPVGNHLGIYAKSGGN